MSLTRPELDYIHRALAALSSSDLTAIHEAKILRTISQISGRAADKIEHDFVERVDQNIANNHLMGVLRHGAT